jgi:hypothetical protein
MKTKSQSPAEATQKKLFKCGALVTLTGKHESFKSNFYCERWACPICKNFRINKLQNKISKYSEIFVYTGVVPENQKHWIERNMKKDYIAIRFDTEKIIISEKTFPGCTRRNKLTFVQALPELLEPITEGRRVSFRRTKPQSPKKKSINDYLGIVAGDHVRELARMTPEERVRWLVPKKDRIIFQNGWKLLEGEMQGGAAPP